MARQAALVSVRVLGCDGRGAVLGVIAGLEYVGARHLRDAATPATANVSIGAPGSPQLNLAADDLAVVALPSDLVRASQ
ncbi:hypothetical protein [Streptomyces sp. NPDC021622]|uniref:hypothetical protein n=1 Tax=Streptomyces sp. NPDC021622 TaxID=3155013 RepID=UPI0033FE1AB6